MRPLRAPILLLVVGLAAATQFGWLDNPSVGEADTCAAIGEVRVPPALADLYPTIDRIRLGRGNPHPSDGETFFNRERRLPIKPGGYYREYVHPTPGVIGPGLRRVVRGCGGDLYFSPDHYRTFIPIGVPIR